jgi:hypothetical protein
VVQVPQSVHFSGSILEMSWPPPAMMAPWGHSLEQALHVMQFSVILCGTINLRNDKALRKKKGPTKGAPFLRG